MNRTAIATIFATLVSLTVVSACGDSAQAQGFGRGGMGQPHNPHLGGQQEVRVVMQTAETLAEAVSLGVFDRHRVQQLIRESSRQLHAILTQYRLDRGARQELSQALQALQQPRLVLERQAKEGLRYVGRALNILITQTGNFRQDIRQLSRLTLILAEGAVFDVVMGTAQNLGVAIQGVRHIDIHSKRRMLQAVDNISATASNQRIAVNEKIRRIELALDFILNQI